MTPQSEPTPNLAEDAPAPKQPSPRMRRLQALLEQASRLGAGPKMEQVAVRDPFGGWVMVTRPIAGK